MVSLSNLSIQVSNCSYNSYFKNSPTVKGHAWRMLLFDMLDRPLDEPRSLAGTAVVVVSRRRTFTDSVNPNRSSRRLDDPPFTRPKNSKKNPRKKRSKNPTGEIWEKQKP
jgi:hypothetical protein